MWSQDEQELDVLAEAVDIGDLVDYQLVALPHILPSPEIYDILEPSLLRLQSGQWYSIHSCSVVKIADVRRG